ncbi:MAG: response regulator transcription factor [Anaerolineae bacterium]|nr:response regulator transcription factor [Anaerolineae bacterium]
MTNPMKALIIEDNADLNTLYSSALAEAGFITESMFDGEKAQHRLQEIEPQLIVLDLHLPKLSGADLLAQIRQDPRLQEIFIIVASADGTWTGHIGEKADMVLNKPVSYVQLRDLGIRVYQNLSKA